MKFNFKKEVLENPKEKTVRFHLFEEDEALTFQRVISLWKSSDTFRHFYSKILQDCEFEAFFWEHPPLNKHKFENPYEFVLINSTSLTKAETDLKSFSKFFDSEEQVVSFANLGGDAKLIVPCPISKSEIYSHLANFIRNAETEQLNKFWEKVANEISLKVGNSLKWISTSGLGVYYLHVRIDSRPKYYQYSDYKEIS